MLRHLTFQRSVRLLAFLLCLVALTVTIFYPTTKAHAANNSASPNYVQGPPVDCLDVSATNTGSPYTVAVAVPPGGGVQYVLTIYVTAKAPCKTSDYIDNIEITSQANLTCPDGSVAAQPPPLVYSAGYGLYPPGGYGNTYDRLDYCEVFVNGIPTAAILPLTITRTTWATGTLTTGSLQQEVTSNYQTIGVW